MKKVLLLTLILSLAATAQADETQALSDIQNDYSVVIDAASSLTEGMCPSCSEKLNFVAVQIADLAERLYQLELRLVYLEEDLNGTRFVIGDPSEQVMQADDLDTLEKINNAQISIEQLLKTLYAHLVLNK